MHKNKYSIYQVFTRLFGNTNTNNTPWGTIEQNGVGKFNDFTDKALQEIKALGITHIWYTGVPHHALIGDYTDLVISNDHPLVVKGRAGSPYAVKDYYSVNPDLAQTPKNRMQEFEALVERSHRNGLKVIIDIVPNHVARQYQGLNNPSGVKDFGADDDTSLEYHRDNNFYYLPDQSFEAPDIPESLQPLGCKQTLQFIAPFDEFPAKWTGNGSRLAKPSFDDWYETVKVNYGVRPDGSHDFPSLPAGFEGKTHQEHLTFWQQHQLPNSWYKFRDIALYWLEKGVDGFRYDMAEMVPVEFWSFMNSSIKAVNPNAFLMAEVYQPDLYRDYIHKGKMDYLYDKVDLYDSLKAIIRDEASTNVISPIYQRYADIEHHLLHFLDNHDEQRLACDEFAGSGENGKPAMLVSTLLSSAPTMTYFGQEVGERGAETGGFGQPSRTSIFDYVGVPAHQRWMNNGEFDGGQLSESERQLRDFYQSLLNFSLECEALTGEFDELYQSNQAALGDKGYLFGRHNDSSFVLAAANFDKHRALNTQATIPEAVISAWQLSDGIHQLTQQIDTPATMSLIVRDGIGYIHLELPPLAAFAYTL